MSSAGMTAAQMTGQTGQAGARGSGAPVSMRARAAGTINRGNGLHEVTLTRTDIPSPGGVGALEQTFSIPVTAEDLEHLYPGGLCPGDQLTLTLNRGHPSG